MRYLIVFITFLLSVTFYGQNDYSMSFDGVDDYVETFSPVFTPNENDLTVMAFVKSQGQSNSERETIISWYRCGSDCYSPTTDKGAMYEIEVNNNILQWKLRGDTDGETDDLLVAEAPYDEFWGDGNWHHVVGTFERETSTAKLFIDGIEIDSNNYFQLDLISSGTIPIPLTFGYTYLDDAFSFPDNNTYFNGYIDEVSIWTTALSQSEIQNYMNCPPTGNEEGLIGCWNFEEGSGTTVFDQTENGNDGAINGATYITDVPEQNCIDQDCSDIEPNFNFIGSIDDCCYYTYNDATSWTEANAICENYEGSLVTINNLNESDLLNNLLGNPNTSNGNQYWINLIDGESEWNNGDTLDFTNYDTSYVSEEDDYMFLQNNGYWDNSPNDGSGSNTGIYPLMEICQSNDSEPSNSSGCTDSLANNYNPEATLDDGTCCYLTIAQNDTTICEGDSISLGINGLSPVNWTEIYLEDFEDGEAQGWEFLNGGAGGQNVLNIDGNNVWRMSSDWNILKKTINGYPDPVGLSLEFKAKWISGTWAVGFRNNILDWNDNTTDGYEFGYNQTDNIFNRLNGVVQSSYPQVTINDWHTYRIEELGADCKFYIDGILVFSQVNVDQSSMGSYMSFNGWGPVIWNNTPDRVYYDDIRIEKASASGISSTFSWSTGDTTETITVSPTQTTTYWVEQTENGVSCTDSVTVTVSTTSEPSYTEITACDSVVWNGNTYTESGTYSYGGGDNAVDSILFDQFTMNATSYFSHETPVTNLGSNYTIKVSGTYGYGGWSSPSCVDAAYAWCGQEEDGYPLVQVWTWNEVSGIYPTPSDYNENHIYFFPFLGDGSSHFFEFIDNGGYGDNNGALDFSIYELISNMENCDNTAVLNLTIVSCGCTDSEAINYNLEAVEDDGSCCYDIDYVNDTYDQGYADGVDSVICPENNCPADLNLDDLVSTADLLILLVSFGTICE